MDTRENNFLVPYISTDRQYWLVRTKGGEYYKSFYYNNYIGISWNEIDRAFIEKNKYSNKDQNKDPEISKDAITEFYTQIYHNDETKLEYHIKNSQRIATMINRFFFKMKAGDIVLIPSAKSDMISFGEIEDSPPYYETIPERINSTETKIKKDEELYCPFIKRRRVKWIKTIRKSELDSNLYSLLYSQHTVNFIDAEQYGNYIDRTIDSIYVKGDVAHLVLNVKQRGDIGALAFANIITESVSLVNGFEGVNTNVDGERIKLKANVQSPGPLELFGPVQEMMMLVSIITDIYGSNISTFSFREIFKKKKKDEVKDVSKIINSDSFKKYRRRVESEKLSNKLGELGVEDPTEDVNSVPNSPRPLLE